MGRSEFERGGWWPARTMPPSSNWHRTSEYPKEFQRSIRTCATSSPLPGWMKANHPPVYARGTRPLSLSGAFANSHRSSRISSGVVRRNGVDLAQPGPYVLFLKALGAKVVSSMRLYRLC
jgi:hypothetical protein